MASERNIYKYNLDILKNIEIGQTLYYEENKIIIEDRYLGYFRYGNNNKKIIEIIKICFLHFYNQLELNLIQERLELFEYLSNVINGLKILINTLKDAERETMNYENLKLDFTSLLINLNNNDIDIEESDDDTDSENCLKSMLKTTQEHLQMNDQNMLVNTIFILKNKFMGAFFFTMNYLFDMTNF